ncbi:MAG: GNAT family protein [Myxococcota bacterium]|jgi:RimJ/RimL family protein N-acetyltransferase
MNSGFSVPNFMKVATLKNGVRVVLRPCVPGDRDRLLEFFRRLPQEDRLSLREDVTKVETIERWLDIEGASKISVVAETRERLIGDATLHMWPGGWHRHIGEIRLVTDVEFRGEGLGTILAGELVSLALQFNLDKLVAQVMKDQKAVLMVLERLGFRKEAELRDHIMDLGGRKHDLVIMTNFVSVLWESLHDSEFYQVRLNHMED